MATLGARRNTPTQNETDPVLIEELGYHNKPEGGNVLYLDGHVEFVPYPGKWPMTEKTMAILQSLQALAKPQEPAIK